MNLTTDEWLEMVEFVSLMLINAQHDVYFGKKYWGVLSKVSAIMLDELKDEVELLTPKDDDDG